MPGRFLLPDIIYLSSMPCEITIKIIMYKIGNLKNINVFIKILSPMEVLEFTINIAN